MMLFRFAHRVTRLASLWGLCTACSAGTETDNPLDDEGPRPPTYESPPRFDRGDSAPACPPPSDDTGPERGPYWDRSGELLVGVEPHLGLVVLDASDPALLVQVASMPLYGQVHAVAVHDGALAVVIDEAPAPPGDRIPTPEELELQLRLVHYDLTDASTPRRVGSVDLDGAFWSLLEREGVLWVTRTPAALEEDSCQIPGTGCGYLDRTALVVQGFSFTSDGFAVGDSLQLPMNRRAWSSQDGFVSVTGDNDQSSPLTLHVARIDGDRAVVSEHRAEAPPRHGSPVGVVGSHLYYFTDSADGDASALHVVDVSEDAASELSVVTGLVGAPSEGVSFAEGQVVVSDESMGGSGTLISLADPANPTVQALPPGVSMAWPLKGADGTLPTGALLGWGDVQGQGRLSVGVVGETGLERVMHTAWPAAGAQQGQPLYPPQLVSANGRVAFAFTNDEGSERSRQLAVVDPTSDPVTLRAFDEFSYGADIVQLDGAFAVASRIGVTTVLADRASSDADNAGWLDFAHRDVLDVVAVPQGRLTLQRERDLPADNLRTRAIVSALDGVEAGMVELPGGARRLLPIGEFVAVLVDPLGNECEQAQAADCDERGIVVLDLRNEPTTTGDVELPSLGPLTEGGERSWLEPLRYDDDSWILVSAERQSCVYVDECEALDIDYVPLSEANVAFGTPVCPPGSDCVLPPPPEVYGTRTVQHVYRLDVSAVGKPAFTKLGQARLELPDARFAEPQVVGDSVLVTRLELDLKPGQSFQNTPARFMLDRFPVDVSTELSWTSLNVPGYPVGMANEGTRLFTVQPSQQSEHAGILHRLRVEDDGVHIEASRPLDGRYGDLFVLGERAYYVRQGVDGCTPGELQVIALDGSLPLLESMTLPGANWRVSDQSGMQLTLRGPNYGGYALISVDRPEPELKDYVSSWFVAHEPRSFGAELWSL